MRDWISILLSIATMMKSPLPKIDFTRAFLQTGSAKSDVYGVLPRECRCESFYWLLLRSGYGLVNANAKCQKHCDSLFLNMGLCQSRFVPQLFYALKDRDLGTMVVKVDDDDDVIITGKRSKVQNFISSIKLQYELGTIVFGHGSFLFYEHQIIQDTYILYTSIKR